MKKLLVLSILFTLTLTPIFFSCEKSEEGDNAPELPPLSSIQMDFSAFTNGQKSGAIENSFLSNYGEAVITVTIWNGIATGVSLIPVTAFAESFNHKAEFLGDATWQWAYSVPFDGDTIKARLEGEVLPDSAEWRMYLSYVDVDGESSYEDFLWIKGRSALDRSGGYWLLYESEASPNELLKIDWRYESEDIGSLKYTNVKPNANDNGNYIKFEKYATDENSFNRRYTIFNLTEDKSTIIEWNSETIVGRINPYNEDVWRCWDENFNDVDCTP